MVQTLVEYIAHMFIRKGIIYDFSVLAVFDQLRLLEYPELVRYRGFRHSEQHRDIAYAHLGAQQRAKYLNARRIAEYFEEIRKIDQEFLIRHMLSDIRNDVLVDRIAIASVRIRCIGAHL